MAWIFWFMGHVGIAFALYQQPGRAPLPRALGEYFFHLGIAAVPVGMVYIANRLRPANTRWYMYLLALVMLGSALTVANAWLTQSSMRDLEAARTTLREAEEARKPAPMKSPQETSPTPGQVSQAGVGEASQPSRAAPAKREAPKQVVPAPSTPAPAPSAAQEFPQTPPESAPAREASPRVSAKVVCANYVQVMSAIEYPKDAYRAGIEDEVVIEFVATADGRVKDLTVISSSSRAFHRVALDAVRRLQCRGDGQDVKVQAPISFRLR